LEQEQIIPTLILKNLDEISLRVGYEDGPDTGDTRGTFYVLGIMSDEQEVLNLAFNSRDDALSFLGSVIQIMAASQGDI
jgi:hypothetical protein